MARLQRDIRYAFRAAIRQRSVSALTIVALALGIGITTAVFSIFNAVLLAPLPYPDPQQLVSVYDTQPACATCPASLPKYQDWKERNRVFAAIGGITDGSAVLTGRGDPEQLRGASVTASFNDVFRAAPVLGRWFTAQEDAPGAPKVVVVAYGYWVRLLDKSPSVIGQRLILDGVAHEIVGVMPETFSFRNADIYRPLARAVDPSTRGSHFLVTYARLKPGVSVERASVEMRALGVTLAKEFGTNHGIDVRSLQEAIVGSIRTPLRVLLGAVTMVLLIACANVANLLLAAGFARRREFAIRVAVGAGHADIARQLMWEALVLAAAGGVLGVGLAAWLVRVFVALAGTILPRASTVHVDARVVLFAAALTIAVGIVCGLSPLLRLHMSSLTSAIREGDMRTATGGRAFGSGIVIAEIALAFALLVGAGLLAKNLVLLQQRDPGFRSDHVIAFDLALPGQRYADGNNVSVFYRQLHERLAQLPGVQQVGVISHLPMYRFGNNGEQTREGGNPWGPNENPLVEYRYMYGNYLGAMGIPLLRGRLLDARDGQRSNDVLINQAMADKFWPGEDPIGKRFGQGGPTGTWYQVVGVIGNVRSFGLARSTPYEFYRTTDQVPVRGVTVVLRSTGSDPAALIPNARAVVNSLDPGLPLTQVQTLDQVVSASVGQPRLLSALTGLFGVLAGLLAMVGVYGVTAYNVRRERREYGIRLALGAEPSAVRRLIVSRGAAVAGIGIALGGAGALLLTRALQAMLNDVAPTDPSVFAINALLVFAVAVAACYLPARWAARVDPGLVLRD